MNCTSLNNCKRNDYCPNCSHARFTGSGRDRNGRRWQWEFNTRFGPVFLRQDKDTTLKHQPCGEHHPAWAPFNRWFRRWAKQHPIKKGGK